MQDAMLFKISGNAEILNSIVTPLSKILGCSSSTMIHTAIMQRRNPFYIHPVATPKLISAYLRIKSRF